MATTSPDPRNRPVAFQGRAECEFARVPYDKAVVKYTDQGSPEEHCGVCQHYQGNGSCEVVKGKVVPAGWCNRFKPATRADRAMASGRITSAQHQRLNAKEE